MAQVLKMDMAYVGKMIRRYQIFEDYNGTPPSPIEEEIYIIDIDSIEDRVNEIVLNVIKKYEETMEPLDYMYKRNKFYKKINSKLYKILNEPNPHKINKK